MFRAYKYKLNPTKDQAILLSKHIGCARFIYNWALGQKTKAYQQDKVNLSRYELQAQLPAMKKQAEYSWLQEVSSQTLQAKLADLDMAYNSFFQKKARYPKFKSKKNKQSFHVPQNTKINFEDKKIVIPKFLEGIKLDAHRTFEGKIKSSTITKTPTGKYFISILVETDIKLPTKPAVNESTIIGIDLGITNFITTSDGNKVDNPRPLKKHLKKLRRASRKHSKKQKGSKNREKSRIKLAKIHEKVTNTRKDFHHKLSHKLTHDNQVGTIVMETLNIRGMVKNKRLARHIQDCSWYQFQSFLKYKCDWYGKNFIQIGQFEPSSKLCSCGVINHQLKLKDRTWTCASCGVVHDRDILASNNIKKLGLVQPEVTPVETCVSGS